MNKNLVIGILAAMLILASLWGQVGNKGKKALQHQLKSLTAGHVQTDENTVAAAHGDMAVTAAHTMKTVVKHEEIQHVDKNEIADAKKILEVTEAQLATVRQKLADANKAKISMQALVAKKDASLRAVTQEKQHLVTELGTVKKAVTASSDAQHQIAALHQKIKQLSGAMQAKDHQFKAAHDEFAAIAQKKEQALKEANAKLAAAQKALKDFEAQCASSKDASKEMEEQLAAYQDTVKELEAKVEGTETARQQCQEKLDNSTTVISQLQGKIEGSEAVIQELQAKLEEAETAAAKLLDESRLAKEYETANAQVIGLEKIVEEKNAVIEETSKELDRLKVNMDVLLARIAEQQDAMQELRDESRELVKELAVKNKELADLNEQLIQTPVQQ